MRAQIWAFKAKIMALALCHSQGGGGEFFPENVRWVH